VSAPLGQPLLRQLQFFFCSNCCAFFAAAASTSASNLCAGSCFESRPSAGLHFRPWPLAVAPPSKNPSLGSRVSCSRGKNLRPPQLYGNLFQHALSLVSSLHRYAMLFFEQRLRPAIRCSLSFHHPHTMVCLQREFTLSRVRQRLRSALTNLGAPFLCPERFAATRKTATGPVRIRSRPTLLSENQVFCSASPAVAETANHARLFKFIVREQHLRIEHDNGAVDGRRPIQKTTLTGELYGRV